MKKNNTAKKSKMDKRRLYAAIIASVLVLAMIVPLVLGAIL